MNSQSRVVVFTTQTCTWCSAVKQHLKKHQIKFKEIDINKDPSGAQDMIKRTGQMGVPVILINNKPIIGFNKVEINKLLNIKGG